MSISTENWECVPLSGSGGPYAIRMPYPDPTKNPTYYGIQGIGVQATANAVAAVPAMLAALEEVARAGTPWTARPTAEDLADLLADLKGVAKDAIAKATGAVQ